jgi:RTX calcium-binding nonapeptide repeat (4 copies)
MSLKRAGVMVGLLNQRLGILTVATLVLSLGWTPAASAEAGSYRLWAGETLRPGEQLVSPNRAYRLVMQEDGNLVQYGAIGQAVWSSRTHRSGSALEMQADGNAVVYAPGHVAVWESKTVGSRAHTIEVQDDRNLVMYAPGHEAVWSTGRALPQPGSGTPPAVTTPSSGGGTRPSGSNSGQPTQASPDIDSSAPPAASSAGVRSSVSNKYLLGHPHRCMIIGTDGNDVIRGTAGNDVICGLGGNDVIFALGGDDKVFGGPGNDEIHGGDGNDSDLSGDEDADRIWGNAGKDRLFGERLLEVSTGFGDRIYGGPDADNLHGGPGDDLMNTGTAPLHSAAGIDFAWGGPGNDVIIGGAAWSDHFWGDDGDDILFPFPGRLSPLGNSVKGGKGDDLAILVNGLLDVFSAGDPLELVKVPIGSGCSASVAVAEPGKGHELSCAAGGRKGKVSLSVGTNGKVTAGGSFLDGLANVSVSDLDGQTRTKLGRDVCACDPGCPHSFQVTSNCDHPLNRRPRATPDVAREAMPMRGNNCNSIPQKMSVRWN